MSSSHGTQHIFFDAPADVAEAIHKRFWEVLENQNTYCDGAEGMTTVADAYQYSSEEKVGIPEEYLLEYLSDDYNCDGPYRDLQEAFPEVQFRYVERGMSFS